MAAGTRGGRVSDVADILDATASFVRRFVVLNREQADALALWTFHTHALDASDATPYIAVSSPEKRSGKTRLLEVLALLVRAPLPSANISDAALFRAIEERAPTLLMDEIDSVFGPKARDREDLRGLLNAGYRRGTPALRIGGAKMTTLETFTTFCPKALSGLGELPDTIADRSIPIRLKRRKADEYVQRFRHRDAQAEAEPLRQALESVAPHHTPTLAEASTSLPDALSDRAQDIWEPLLAIADLAGDEWAARARAAAVALSGDEDVLDDTLGVRLLADIRAAFAANGDRLATAALLDALKADEEAPWLDWRGTGLNARRLGDLLRRYGVTSRTVRFSDETTAKGYRLDQFADAFERYLPPSDGGLKGHNVTTRMDTGETAVFKTSHDAHVTASEIASNPHGQSDVTDVTAKRAENGRRELSEQEKAVLRDQVAREQLRLADEEQAAADKELDWR
jgi:hypothetical protein